jgi:ribA/ribD-fused uncharacterized protein
MRAEAIQMIRFLHPTGEYGFLSNAFPCNFKLKDLVWSSVEHYYHAQKFLKFAEQEAVRNAPTVKEAIERGTTVGRSFRLDWTRHRLGAMREAIRAKFAQSEDLKAKLLATGDVELIRDSKLDDYWGAGAENLGENMIGKILMEVREELRNGG